MIQFRNRASASFFSYLFIRKHYKILFNIALPNYKSLLVWNFFSLNKKIMLNVKFYSIILICKDSNVNIEQLLQVLNVRYIASIYVNIQCWRLFVGRRCTEFNFFGHAIQESSISCSDTCPDIYNSSKAYLCKGLLKICSGEKWSEMNQYVVRKGKSLMMHAK